MSEFWNSEENFPDWTDESLGIDGMIENFLNAEEKHAVAKENIFHEMIRIGKETIENGPDFLKNAPFMPGKDLMLFRGMPLDAILCEGFFDIFEAVANDGEIVFCVRVFVDFQDNGESIGMFGALVLVDDNDIEHAWDGTEWTDKWEVYDDGLHNCYTCENQAYCAQAMMDSIKENEFQRTQALGDEIEKKFPKLKKYLKRNHVQMLLLPSEDSPALQMCEKIMKDFEESEGEEYIES